ncbi:MAG: hypothetical protein HZT40_20460 [Candidatus Thiothrix singaporensis]|uniref:Uncharacterized protein n=1 Tax=Candidatus Thiothrix singaporensis TaxID=2799669 RepID=A0A7L6AWY0_9GAMM|nr:MAG: hypothetical protein HZT40_20460 [Candidatus Thiothrix singaporensis]
MKISRLLDVHLRALSLGARRFFRHRKLFSLPQCLLKFRFRQFAIEVCQGATRFKMADKHFADSKNHAPAAADKPTLPPIEPIPGITLLILLNAIKAVVGNEPHSMATSSDLPRSLLKSTP